MHLLPKYSKDNTGSPYRIMLWPLALAPVLAYALFVGNLHRDLPIFDDYIIQLEIARLKAAPGLVDKGRILFSQLNEHRLAYTRFCFWLVHTLNGTISYSALIVLGNLSLLGIWGLAAWLLYRLRVSPIALVPLSWLLFQFHYHDNSLWAMASLQNLTIHFLYPLLFVLLLSPHRAAWLASWGVASWLCFTSGNGFMALVLAGGGLVYQRRWRQAAQWTALTGGLLLLYFWSYQRPPDFPAIDSSTLLDKGLAMLVFLGLHLDMYATSTSLSYYVLNGLVVGLPVALLTLWSSWRLATRWRARQPVSHLDGVLLVSVLVSAFLVMSAAAVVQNRLNFLGWLGLTDSRYRLYSSMLVLTGYVQLMAFAVHRQWSTTRLGWTWLALSALVWAGIYKRQIGPSYLFRSQALAHYHNWTQLQSQPTQAFIAGVFRPSGHQAADLERIKTGVARQAGTYPLHTRVIQSLTQQGETYLIQSTDEPNSQSPDEWNMLVFWASDHTLIFPVVRAPNANWRSFWLDQTWFSVGFKAHATKWFLKKQPYQLGFLKNRFDSLTVYRTHHLVHP